MRWKLDCERFTHQIKDMKRTAPWTRSNTEPDAVEPGF